MISIIICSIDIKRYLEIEKNIGETIGVVYETIKVPNPGTMGLCEAYNKGGKIANYNILCFVHEDILFRTQNWGRILIDHFANLIEVGIIGLAGSVFKNRMLSSWWQEPVSNMEPKRCRLTQHFKFQTHLTPEYWYYKPI